MSIFKDRLWQAILDGKKDWQVSEKTPEACDLFEVEIVRPLRALQNDGLIKIEEVEAPMPGQLRVVYVLLREIVRLEDE